MTSVLIAPCEEIIPRRLFTVKEYELAGELGLFRPDERLELIEGVIIQKMAPQLSPHAVSIMLIDHVLGDRLPRGYHVRAQMPLTLGDRSEPEPDIAIVAGSIRDDELGHPSTALLVVEVADSTLHLDRTVKARLYATANVPEYWIVNLKDRTLCVHREPYRSEVQPSKAAYREVRTYQETEFVEFSLAPETRIEVSALLPRRRD